MNNQSKVRCVMCILLSRDLCSCRKSTQLTQSSPTISNMMRIYHIDYLVQSHILRMYRNFFLKQVLLINSKDKKLPIQCVMCKKILSHCTATERLSSCAYPASVCFFLYACFICIIREQWQKNADFRISMFLKGQLISKCLFGAIILTKKPTIFFKNFCPSL